MNRKLTFHTDPGHGWLEVPRDDLDTLDIAHRISRYSYERADRVYLEEDCDAAAYMQAAQRAGWTVTTREQYAENTPIRNMRPYEPRVTPAALLNAINRFGKLHA